MALIVIFFKNFQKKFEKNVFFEKNFRKKFREKNFPKKKFCKKNFEKILCVEKIFYFARFLKAIFQKMKFSKINQWQLVYDYFYANFNDL